MKRFLILFCMIIQGSIKPFYKKKFTREEYINPLIVTDDHNQLHKLIIDGTPLNESYDYISPLLDALLKNKRKKALFLLLYGAQPNCIKDGITPLRWAIDHQDYELVLALLKAQARLDKNDAYRAQKVGNQSIYKLLSYTLQYRSCGRNYLSNLDKEGLAPIHEAAKNGNKEQLDALILVGVPFNLLSRDGKTALHYLALNNHIKLIEYAKNNFHCKYYIKDAANMIPRDYTSHESCKKILS